MMGDSNELQHKSKDMAVDQNSSQKQGNVPLNVISLYGKRNTTPKSKFSKTNSGRNEDKKQKKIATFFTKSTGTRNNRFEENRRNNLEHSTPAADVEEMSMNELNAIMAEANEVMNESNALLQSEEMDVKQMFSVMLKMNRTMFQMMTQLKSAVESKNKVIINKFTDQLKNCTTFISNEINHVKKEIDKVKKNDEIECIKTVQACSRDLKKIWIRFVYAKDAEDLRTRNNHASIKNLLTQMNIKVDLAQYPIESFFYQSKTFEADQVVPEIALCCIFVNPTLASVVKNGIRNFNKYLEENEQAHLIRYKVSTDWSYNTRTILKPCNEMRRFNVIDKVLITIDGIKVYHEEIIYNEQPERKSTTTIVNSMKKLDMLRRKLRDFNFSVTAAEAYNKEYFSKSFNERKLLRDNYMTSSTDNDEEYPVSEDEYMDASVVETHQ